MTKFAFLQTTLYNLSSLSITATFYSHELSLCCSRCVVQFWVEHVWLVGDSTYFSPRRLIGRWLAVAQTSSSNLSCRTSVGSVVHWRKYELFHVIIDSCASVDCNSLLTAYMMCYLRWKAEHEKRRELGVMIGSANRKYWLTFGEVPVRDRLLIPEQFSICLTIVE